MNDTTEQQNPSNRLESLAAMTQEADAANPSAEQQQEAAAEAAAVSESEAAARQWAILMFTIGGFAQMIEPELKQIYSEDRCLAWGVNANAVAEKYGINSPSAMPELALIVSTAGFFVPTVFVVRAKIKEAKDGSGPASWIAKIGLWWRTRRARRAGEVEDQPDQEGQAHGGKQ